MLVHGLMGSFDSLVLEEYSMQRIIAESRLLETWYVLDKSNFDKIDMPRLRILT